MKTKTPEQEPYDTRPITLPISDEDKARGAAFLREACGMTDEEIARLQFEFERQLWDSEKYKRLGYRASRRSKSSFGPTPDWEAANDD
jgi:hypothetical protein